MLRDIHYGNSWYFSNSPLQVSIACSDNIAFLLFNQEIKRRPFLKSSQCDAYII